MYWADELAAAVTGPQVVNDSKTPSGTVHVGSLRGVVLHDAIARALRDAGHETRFLYGVDDLDPMDAQALLTPDAIDRYMGVPLSQVPAPDGSSAASYARHFVGQLFMGTFEGLGIHPEIYWMSDLYADGTMDRYIRIALDRAEVVRQVYLRVSNVEKAAGWLPVSIICENCGKIGTTLATDWDGETVAYACKPDYVVWARGCGHSGRVVPVAGRAKLPFNVDWAAKWSHFGVTIEGCGKDLGTKGGSRDRSDAVAREVFDREPPVNVLYEFLNIGGKKMSTSKGTGASAHAMAETLPPELLRFLFLRHKPRKAIGSIRRATPSGLSTSSIASPAVAGCEVRGELPPEPADLPGQPGHGPTTGHRGRPLPASVPPPRTPGPGAGRRSRCAHGGREGGPSRRGRTGDRGATGGRGTELADRVRALALPGRGARTSCPTRPPRSTARAAS
jgi:lysyl-tRNA synthetase class 1